MNAQPSRLGLLSRSSLLLVLAAGVLLPASAPAQTNRSVHPVLERGSFSALARSQELVERVESLEYSRRDAARGARLLLEAAYLRAPQDPMVVHLLYAGANRYRMAGNERAALATLERAASHALDYGEVALGAHMLLNAASLAQEMGESVTTQRLAVRAERLIHSPHLTTVERSFLERRITRQVTLADRPR